MKEGRFFCVYCEKDFPAGTPIQEFKDHVVICKKHPLAEVKIALEESVKLQSHYAELLNMFDGGERITFKSAAEWTERLQEIGKIPKNKVDMETIKASVRKAIDKVRPNHEKEIKPWQKD